MRILIDARKAFHTGIGTYIRGVVPRVIDRMGDSSFSILVEPGGCHRHAYIPAGRATFVELAAAPLGFREQASLRRIAGRSDLFWATSLAHPLYSRMPFAATVHDVAQIAPASHFGAGRVVEAAARVFFHSLRTSARLLIFNSAFTQSEFHKWVGVSKSPHLVTPLGVDATWFDRVEPAASTVPPRWVCLSNARPHKNLLLLLLAFHRITDRVPHRLVLVGKEEGYRSHDEHLRSAVAQLGDRIEFTGFQTEPELRRRVSMADAVVIPSLYEGFGLPALEAMAAGTPVIAAHAGALPEVCGPCARYFDPMSIDSLSEQLLAHADTPPEERARQRACAVERARAFNWDKTAELTANAFYGMACASTA